MPREQVVLVDEQGVPVGVADKSTVHGRQTPPAAGEPVADAGHRRLRDELGHLPSDLRLVLPDFSYRASWDGVEENELCPVFVCVLDTDPRPDPAEVEAWQWWPWERFLDECGNPDGALSPWARLQGPLLGERGGPLHAGTA